MNTLRPGLQWR